MGLIVKQDGQRSQLRDRVAAELREKAQRTSLDEGAKTDFVEDSVHQRDMKQTTSLAGAWVALFVLVAVAILIVFLTLR
ncbi:hypothetical protein FWD07_01195 [Candidatus Saccharibacteria bacterium]|nr:hypothetical protein [Candidatus Saccharibacteria bacterium]